MSVIYFHSYDGSAEVRGSERAYFASICSGIAWSIFDNVAKEYGLQKSILRKALPKGHFALSASDFSDALALTLRVGDTDLFVEDKPVSAVDIALNTAYFMGSDPIKLAARLHGQCEIHTYVEGINRRWLASIIKQGRDIELYRGGQGWESVIDLLLSDDTSPVVTSYSVCDSFPNPYVANYTPQSSDDGELDDDAWYYIPKLTRWSMALNGLRSSKSGLELNPEDWGKFYFARGIDANKLVVMLREQQGV